jgi:hypothetical protein
MIWMLRQVTQQQLAPWLSEGQASDSVFRAMASVPMQWVGLGVSQDLPFDAEEFFAAAREKKTKRGAEGDSEMAEAHVVLA